MDIEDIPGIGAFGTVGVVFVDLLAHGGDVIVALLLAFVQTFDLWVPFLSALDQWARETGLISTELTSQLLTVAITLLVIYYLARILRQIWKSFKGDNNET